MPASLSDEEEASASDQQSEERCGSYSLSADVSESESSGTFPSHHHYYAGSSSSSASPLPKLSTGQPGFLDPMLMTPNLMFQAVDGKDVLVWDHKPPKRNADLSEMEMMKERFAKLLLGEDMSGEERIPT